MEDKRNIEDTILMYTNAWNETERENILAKVSQIWAPEGTYMDNLTDAITGAEALTELIVGSYSQMGPRKFQVLEEPQVHHRCGRFRWLAVRAQGYPIEGMDYFEFNDKNLITRIVGFF
jgi:hypothetical protein